MAHGFWSMFEEMGRLREELDKFLGGESVSWRDLPFSSVSFLPARAPRAYPLVNISEDSERYLVEALAPGLDTSTLDISVAGNQLSVSGTKQGLPAEVQSESRHRVERAGGSFHRTVNLPGEIDRDRIRAEYRNGLLRISVPKPETARPRRISVKVS